MSEGNGHMMVADRTEQIRNFYATNPGAKTKVVAAHFGVSPQTIAITKKALGLTKTRVSAAAAPRKRASTKVGKAIVDGLKSGKIAKTTIYTTPSQSVVLDFVASCGGAKAAKAAIDGVADLFR